MAWLKGTDFRVAFVGPDGNRDNLMKWLRGRNVVAVRPWVVYNHLAVRAALNEAMGNPEVTPAPQSLLADIQTELEGLEEALRDNMRALSAEHVQEVEASSQAAADDEKCEVWWRL